MRRRDEGEFCALGLAPESDPTGVDPAILNCPLVDLFQAVDRNLGKK